MFRFPECSSQCVCLLHSLSTISITIKRSIFAPSSSTDTSKKQPQIPIPMLSTDQAKLTQNRSLESRSRYNIMIDLCLHLTLDKNLFCRSRSSDL